MVVLKRQARRVAGRCVGCDGGLDILGGAGRVIHDTLLGENLALVIFATMIYKKIILAISK